MLSHLVVIPLPRPRRVLGLQSCAPYPAKVSILLILCAGDGNSYTLSTNATTVLQHCPSPTFQLKTAGDELTSLGFWGFFPLSTLGFPWYSPWDIFFSTKVSTLSYIWALFLLLFWDRVSLNCPGWVWTCRPPGWTPENAGIMMSTTTSSSVTELFSCGLKKKKKKLC